LIKVLFKENIYHFVSTLQPIGQLNLKAFFSQTNSKFNAVFAKQSKQHHFLIKESIENFTFQR
jgi:hypothetical protein